MATVPSAAPQTPFVELVVEFKWQIAAQLVIGFGSLPTEALYQAFGQRVATRGFTSVERLVPANQLGQPGTAAIRYRSTHDPVLYQLGFGLFTANAVTPYAGWASFQPALEAGLADLFAVGSDEIRGQPNITCAVKYLNAFQQDDPTPDGRNIREFIRDRLGFNFIVPEAIGRRVEAEQWWFKTEAQFSIGDDRKLSVAVAPGVIGNSSIQSVLLDWSINKTFGPCDGPPQALANFAQLQQPLHDMFMELNFGG